jgi:hypothetical protein
MNPQLIQKVNLLIETLNSKQQQIARNLILDPKFEFQEIFIRNQDEIYMKDLKTGEVFHFLTLVKSKCNCD